MRAISAFSFEAGTSSFWWRERIALRMRARKSATGSVKLMLSPSSSVRSGLYIDQAREPAKMVWLGVRGTSRMFKMRRASSLPGGLHDAGDLAAQRESAEAQAADAKLAQECARAAA